MTFLAYFAIICFMTEMEHGERFNEPPKLPEHYRSEVLAGLLPGSVIFPWGHALRADSHTGYLFVNTTKILEKSDIEPSDYDLRGMNRVAVTRVYKGTGDHEIDGYIADLRYIEPGAISQIELTVPEGDESLNARFVQSNREGHAALLAAIIKDSEGRTQLNGDPEVFEETVRLAGYVDGRRAAAELKTTEPKSEAVDLAENTSQDTETEDWTGEKILPSGLVLVRR